MAGAAIMCGKAALRSGTGLVHMVVPKEIYPIVAGQLTEPIYTVLYQEHMLQQLDEAMEKATACVIGCGMGTSETAKLILTYVLKHFRHPIVLDADALNIVSGLSTNDITHIYTDKRKTTYVISFTGGISKIRRATFSTAFMVFKRL